MSRRPPFKRPLKTDERELWNKVTKNFIPLDKPQSKPVADLPDIDANPVRLSSRKPALKASTARQGAGAGQRAKHPIDRSGDRQIRRGHVEIDARLDLHGLTRSKARGELLRFLTRAYHDQKRVVLVITGKGADKRAIDGRKFEPWGYDIAPLPGVLRRSFVDWLREPEFMQIVAGYSSAHQKHGGAGAFYVMLRV